jgi:hypothetical protein
MKWTVPLAITTVLFASMTVYFGHALKEAREQRANRTVRQAAKAVRVPDTGQTAAASQPSGDIEQRPLPLSERLSDPRQQAEKLEVAASLARSDLFGLAKRLGLTREQLDSLAALVAKQALRREEGHPADASADRSELVELLGEENAAAYLTFEESFHERFQVRIIRDHLTKQDDLSEEQAAALAAAMLEENKQFAEVARRQGETLYALDVLQGAAKADAPDRQARVLESATAYSQRLRARAASILTPTQLAAYQGMLDTELLRHTPHAPD